MHDLMPPEAAPLATCHKAEADAFACADVPASTFRTAKIALGFEPNALLWCRHRKVLVLADDTHGRLLSWSEPTGLVPWADIERPEGTCSRLGQIAALPNGDLIVASYRGGLLHLGAHESTARCWPALDTERRRLGVAVTAGGEVYETYFTGDSGARCGAVARVGELGGEQDLVAGLRKPIAIIEHDGALIVSDQARNRLVRIPIMYPSIFSSFAVIREPDAVSRGPDGTLLVGTKMGDVLLVDRRGNVEAILRGLEQVRGVAYDGSDRIFVAERSPYNPSAHTLHIVAWRG
jgi:hypothetical protein